MKTLWIAALITFACVAPAAARPHDEAMSGAFRCAAIGDLRTWLECYYGAAQPVRAALGMAPAPAAQVRLTAAPPTGKRRAAPAAGAPRATTRRGALTRRNTKRKMPAVGHIVAADSERPLRTYRIRGAFGAAPALNDASPGDAFHGLARRARAASPSTLSPSRIGRALRRAVPAEAGPHWHVPPSRP